MQVLETQTRGSHTEPQSHKVWERFPHPSFFVSSCLCVSTVLGCGRRPLCAPRNDMRQGRTGRAKQSQWAGEDKAKMASPRTQQLVVRNKAKLGEGGESGSGKGECRICSEGRRCETKPIGCGGQGRDGLATNPAAGCAKQSQFRAGGRGWHCGVRIERWEAASVHLQSNERADVRNKANLE